MWTATEDLTITAEVYHQSLGASDPAAYLTQLEDARYQRGELWLVGTTYASTNLAYQLTPLVMANASWIGNLQDGSGLLAPGLTVSVSDEVQMVTGGFVGLGARPDEPSAIDLLDPNTGMPLQGDALNAALGVNSEFGMYPSSVHVQLKNYF